jgi:hypothetical protein
VVDQRGELLIVALAPGQKQPDVSLGLVRSEARERHGELNDLVEVALREPLPPG